MYNFLIPKANSHPVDEIWCAYMFSVPNEIKFEQSLERKRTI